MLDDDLVELIYGDFAESATTANGERSMIDSVHIEEIITMVRADERERLSRKIKNNISETPSSDNPHRNYILGFNDGLKGAIEAIKAE